MKDYIEERAVEIAYYAEATFQNSRIENKQTLYCQKYVENWEKMKSEERGLPTNIDKYPGKFLGNRLYSHL